MNELNIDDFTDKFPPYGDEPVYVKLLEEYSNRFGNILSLPYSIENYGKVYTAIQYNTPLKQIEKQASGFEHYFINSRTGTELKVGCHQEFAEKVRKNPKLFGKLDLDVNFFAKKQLEYYKSGNNDPDYEWFQNLAPLVRVTYYNDLSFEYAARSNNKNDVAEAVYNFCIKHRIKDDTFVYVSTTTNQRIMKPWAQYRTEYDNGSLRLSSIKETINMNIPKELKSLSSKLAAINLLYDKDNANQEIQKLKDGIKTEFINAYVSNLGGQSSIMLKVIKEPKNEWINGIGENMTIFNFSINQNGVVENFRSSYKPAMRKFMATSIDDVIRKINEYINKQRR